MFSRWWLYPIAALGAMILIAVGLIAYAAIVVYPNLPSLAALTDYQPKIPLQIFSAEGQLIGEFGEDEFLGRDTIAFGVEDLVPFVIRHAHDLRTVDHRRRRGSAARLGRQRRRSPDTHDAQGACARRQTKPYRCQ